MTLVKDVSLSALNQEDHASLVSKFGFSIGIVGGAKPGSEALCALVFWEVVLAVRTRALQQRIFRSRQKSKVVNTLFRVRGSEEVYLWSDDVRADRPPKDEAMVLNSTCFIWGAFSLPPVPWFS